MELSQMEKLEIERKVSTLLIKYGYSFECDTKVDIVDFAKKFGFVVGNADLPEREDGFLAIRPESEDIIQPAKVIAVNANRSLDFKRFIIAHEFAHWVLHYSAEQKKTALLHRESRKGKNQDENDADYFAAALLMPEIPFRRELKELSEAEFDHHVICSQLAVTFAVPVESVERRILEVNGNL